MTWLALAAISVPASRQTLQQSSAGSNVRCPIARLRSPKASAVRAAPQADWPFEPALATRLLAAIGEAIEPLALAARGCAIVTSPMCRAPLSRLMRARFPDIAVLSYLEIPENRQVDIAATVSGSHSFLEPENPTQQEN